MQYHIKGPFTCDHSDKQFGLQSTLTNHKKTHREKDYVCKVGYFHHRTKSYSGYYKHKKYRHLEDKNFQCGFCKCKYQTPSQLSAHHNRLPKCGWPLVLKMRTLLDLWTIVVNRWLWIVVNRWLEHLSKVHRVVMKWQTKIINVWVHVHHFTFLSSCLSGYGASHDKTFIYKCIGEHTTFVLL